MFKTRLLGGLAGAFGGAAAAASQQEQNPGLHFSSQKHRGRVPSRDPSNHSSVKIKEIRSDGEFSSSDEEEESSDHLYDDIQDQAITKNELRIRYLERTVDKLKKKVSKNKSKISKSTRVLSSKTQENREKIDGVVDDVYGTSSSSSSSEDENQKEIEEQEKQAFVRLAEAEKEIVSLKDRISDLEGIVRSLTSAGFEASKGAAGSSGESNKSGYPTRG